MDVINWRKSCSPQITGTGYRGWASFLAHAIIWGISSSRIMEKLWGKPIFCWFLQSKRGKHLPFLPDLCRGYRTHLPVPPGVCGSMCCTWPLRTMPEPVTTRTSFRPFSARKSTQLSDLSGAFQTLRHPVAHKIVSNFQDCLKGAAPCPLQQMCHKGNRL